MSNNSETGRKNLVNRATKEEPVRPFHVSFSNAWKDWWFAFSATSQGRAREGIFSHEDEAGGV